MKKNLLTLFIGLFVTTPLLAEKDAAAQLRSYAPPKPNMSSHPRYQYKNKAITQARVVSPQDIIDDVKGQLDSMACGIEQVGQSVLDELYNNRKREALASIDAALAEWDMECLSSLLDRGFLGMFDINIPNLNLCEYAKDWLEDQGFGRQAAPGSADYKSNMALRARIEKAVREKRKIRKRSW